MLRTLFVFALVLFGIRHAVRGPLYALLFYLWIAYFRPEQWVWGGSVIQQLPLSLLVGVVATVSALLSGKFKLNLRTTVLLAIVVQSLLSTALSPYSQFSWPYWVDFAKSAFISCLIGSLIEDVKQLRLVVLVIALSLGFEAAKQGWLQLVLNPGAKNFNEVAFLGDNNLVAVGMWALVGLFLALGRTAGSRWEKYLHRFLGIGTVYRAISTYSRGGFLACGAIGVIYVARSKRKAMALMGAVVVALLVVPVLPTEFWDRMKTITQLDLNQSADVIPDDDSGADASALGRLHFWRVAVTMANANPITGIGHNAYTQAYDRYDTTGGVYGESRSVHSTWFGTLAELGYPGLFLLLLNIGLALMACRRARKLPLDAPDAAHLREIAIGVETGLIAMIIGGTFVIFQYTEMLWHFIGLSIAVYRLAAERTRPVVAPLQVPAFDAPFVPVAIPAARAAAARATRPQTVAGSGR